MPLSKRLYPFETTSQVGLRLTAEPYDPGNEDLTFALAAREEDSDEDILTLDLSGHQQPWQKLKIDLEAVVPAADLDRVMPPPSDVTADASLLVVVTCPETRLRMPVPLEYSQGAWAGSVTIHRRDVRGTVRLNPKLVRATTVPGSSGEEGVALESGMVIGDGRSFDIRIDPPPPLDGVLRIRWENFPESQHDWRKAHPSDLFFLDQDETEPTLYLNSFLGEFREALNSRALFGGAAVIRHLANASIAQTVWLQLFTTAVGSIERDEDTAELELPPAGWRREILRVLLARSFPGMEVQEQLSRLHALKDEGQEAVLMTTLASAAQAAAQASRAVKRAAGAASRMVGEAEEGN